MPFTTESVFDAKRSEFYPFVGGFFETENEDVIASLKAMGYETVDVPEEKATEPQPKKEKAKK